MCILRCLLVINLHYYNNALLEIFRIHELLPYSCKIISEEPNTQEEKNIQSKYNKIKGSVILDKVANGSNDAC